MPEGETAALAAFLADLDRSQVTLRVAGDRLRCSAPSGVLTGDLLARIRARRAELLAHLSGDRMLPAADRRDPIPLSFPQEQLWLADHLEPGSSAYHLPLDVRLSGALAPARLGQALAELVRRHEVLRTSFPVRRGRPCQQVAAFAPLALPLVDLSGLPAGPRDRVAGGLATAAARRPFRLATGPVLRTALVRLTTTEHRLLLTRHHIASDGWSLGVLAAELTAHYRAFWAGRPPSLPPLPRQYADFAAWQRAAAADPAGRERLAAWRRRLDGARLELRLVAAGTAGGEPAGPAATIGAALAPAERSAARRVARGLGVPVFPVLLAAFGLALASAAGQSEVVVGAPSSGRLRSELEPMIGTFATVLPLRLELTGAGSFRQAVRLAQQRVAEALANQDVPLERILEAVRPHRRPVAGRPPLPVVFAFQNTPEGRLDLPGVQARVADPVPVAAKFPLAVTVTGDGEAGYRLLAEYDPALVAGAAVADLLERFRRVLAEGCGRPELPAGTLVCRAVPVPPVAPPEPAGGGEVAGRPGGLAAAFAARAAAAPDAIAVSQGDHQVSYAGLHQRAARLAAALRIAGVAAETVVGLCVRPGPELPVAVIGTALAGGAYLPLDPEDPPARHETVLADAGARVLVTEPGLAGGFGWFEGPVLLVGAGATGPADPSLPPVHPDQLAYVIYTSGSTGVPKGVMVSHRNATAMLAAARAVHRPGPDDVWTLVHSAAFDFSVWELWAPLLSGGRLVVVPRETARDPDRLWRLLRADQVTVFSATPSAFLALTPVVTAAGNRRPGALRTVVLGGERCEPDRLRDWFDTGDDRCPALVNMYGITETTVHVTWRRLTATDLGARISPIGRPLAGMQVQVVGGTGAPVAVGGEGELLVGGVGVARGYLGRPGLTAGRFRPDQRGGRPGSRLYASGDLGTLLPDRELGYLGRRDDQLKIRGYRIEPGEVEAVLAGHPEVAGAAVGAGPDGQRPALVGYLVPADPAGPPLSIRELRRYCAQRLPAHLVPASFVLLEYLPVNRNGKLDRAALRALPPAPPAPTEQDPPRTPTERALAGLWCELLALPAVGAHDDFFELGGDSLLITRLSARLPALFGVELSMRRIYQALDIASQAAAIDELRAAATREPVGLASRADRDPG